MRRFLVSLLAALLVTAAAATARAACDCPPLPDPNTALANAYATFAGRVLSIAPETFHPATWNVVVVQPTARWRGAVTDPIVVATPNSAAACGVPFVVGQDWLFYCDLGYTGVTYTPIPFVTQCTRTAPYADNPDLVVLPQPVLPVPAHTGTWGGLKSSYR